MEIRVNPGMENDKSKECDTVENAEYTLIIIYILLKITDVSWSVFHTIFVAVSPILNTRLRRILCFTSRLQSCKITFLSSYFIENYRFFRTVFHTLFVIVCLSFLRLWTTRRIISIISRARGLFFFFTFYRK